MPFPICNYSVYQHTDHVLPNTLHVFLTHKALLVILPKNITFTVCYSSEEIFPHHCGIYISL